MLSKLKQTKASLLTTTMRLLSALIFFILFLFLSCTTTTSNAHNITSILAKHPEFSTFNHYLTVTHLAGEINRRLTITVCAVDNAGMSEILSKHFSTETIKNVLCLHVFADYFSAKKLHQISKGSTLTSTLFQATGNAPGTSGYVNITNLKGGKVGFGAEDEEGSHGTLRSFYVKSVQEIPYKISILQISHVLLSPEAEAPAGGPGSMNLTSLMAKQGCEAFTDLLTTTGADDIFGHNVESGLTVFCPSDEIIHAFMPHYKNLTDDDKVSLLLYHGLPVYESLGMLKSKNGLMNTLATEGAKTKYDFKVQNQGEDVNLETKVVTATILGTVLDEEPLAVYKIDKILLPKELFKTAPPELVAHKSKAKAPAPKGQKVTDADEAPEPDSSEDNEPADEKANENGSVRTTLTAGWLLAVAFSLCLGNSFLF